MLAYQTPEHVVECVRMEKNRENQEVNEEVVVNIGIDVVGGKNAPKGLLASKIANETGDFSVKQRLARLLAEYETEPQVEPSLNSILTKLFYAFLLANILDSFVNFGLNHTAHV